MIINNKITRQNEGVSLLTLVITIVVMIILASIVYVSSENTIENAGKASFSSDISDFSEVISEEFMSKKGEMLSEGTYKTARNVYYIVATGEDLDEDEDPISVAQTANIKLKPDNLRGKDIYEIKDDVKLNNLEETGQLIEKQKYYVTDEGEVFIWPGYYVQNEEKWWVNAEKYYEGKKPAGNIESVRPEDGEEDGDTTCKDGHSEVVDAAIEATCTTAGLTEGKHCTTCGEVTQTSQIIKALGHVEAVDLAVAPTCTETGLTEGKHCSRCNEIIIPQQAVAALGHTEVVDAAVEATCSTTGLTQSSHCSVCGEIIVAGNVINKKPHTYGEWLTIQESTCAVEGSKERICSVCNNRELGTILKKSHNYDTEYTIDKKPTCTEPGSESQHCLVCGAKNNIREILATGHKWSEATCTKLSTCEYCGATRGELLAHTPNEEDGKSCVVCGAPLTPEEYAITYNLDGGTVETANPDTYTKYQVITLNNPTRPSYEFLGWTGSNGDTPQKIVTIPKWTTGPKEYTANWKISTANYTVKHWQQTLTGSTTQNDTNYSCVETQTSSGIIGSSVTPAVKTYSGFTAAQTAKTVTIAADGSTNIDYYYTRNSYTITANTGTGISAITGGGTYKYGTNVSISATLETGFGFNYWIIYYNQSNTSEYKYNQTESFTMPAENITVTAYGYDTRTAQALFFSSGQLRFIKDSTIYNAGSTYPGVGTVAACYTGWETGTWDSSQAPYWAINNGSQITTVYFEDKVSPKCTVNWFYNLTNCNTFTNIGANLDMSNVVDTSYMFYNVAFNCTGISLDLSSWNMSSVKNMQYMFGAPEVNYSNSFTTSSKGTYSLNLSKWNLLSVKDMSYAFCNGFICGKSATSGGVTTYNKSGTLKINVTDWKTNNVTNMESMFYRVGSVASSSTIQGLNTWNTGNVTNMKKMFSYMGGGTVNIGTLETWDVSSVQNMESMFDTFANDTTSLTALNLASWDVSSVKTFKNMFMYHGVNLSSWNFGDLSAWEPYNVGDMSYMFAMVASNASRWTPPKIENWYNKVYNVTDMSYMFAYAGENASWSLNLSNWQVDSVTNYKSFDAYNEGKITPPSWRY